MASLWDPEDISQITGNAPHHIKEAALTWYKLLQGPSRGGFGYNVRKGIMITEVSLEPSTDDPNKISTKMVCDLEISPDMCNAQGVLDQGCMIFLMDEGSAISLQLMKILVDNGDSMIGVSQTFNMFFHQPVPTVGSRLKLVNRSVALDEGIGCCCTEVWDVANHRVVVSGSQLQMKRSE